MLEIEIKLLLNNRTAVLRRLRRLGFKRLGRRLLERNLVLDTAGNRLRTSQQLLRLRSTGRRWWLTWKGRPAVLSRHKVRQEIELETSNGERLGDILSRLGYRPAFEYQKYRSEFHQPGRRGKLLVDETPIGDFIELEGPARWIDRVAAQLGYQPQDYILDSYSSLYLASCRQRGLQPGNMVFPKKKIRRK